MLAVFPVLGLVANTVIPMAIGRSLEPGQELTREVQDTWIVEQFPTPTEFISIVGPLQISLLALAFIAAAISPQKTFARLGFVRGCLPWRALPLLMLSGSAMRVFETLLVSLLFADPSAQVLAMRKAFIELSGCSAVFVLLCGSVLPGFCEEAVFRGFVLRGLLRRLNPWLAVVLVGLAFAAIHPGLYIAVLVFPTGVWLGIVAWRTASIWPAIVVHVFFNLADACLERTTPDPTKLYFLQPSLLIGIVLLVSVIALVASIRILARLRPAYSSSA
ncbi:MAG: CPBP family intramembrane metalloprotease [Phycisphaerales bacterium]|nr:MAG: CPBP family intramembrane metalloprotease [Phycisphaerales bacterium]